MCIDTMGPIRPRSKQSIMPEREEALAALNKAYENRQLEVLYLLVDPELDPLRSDLRFQELVGKIGFPQTSGETPPTSTPEQLIQPLH